MGRIKLQQPSDFGTDTVEESGGTSDNLCGLTNYRINSLRGRKCSDTNLSQTYDELKDSVNKLVNNKDKLSAINMLQTDATTSLKGLCTNHRAASVCESKLFDSERTDADVRRTIHSGSVIEKIASRFQKEKEGLDLQKFATNKVNDDDKQLQNSTAPCDSICTAPLRQSTATLFKSEQEQTKHPSLEYTNPEQDLTDHEAPMTQSRNPVSNNRSLTDNALKEFERDMEYLTGCNNRTSTPKKYETSRTSSDQSTFVSPSTIIPVNRSKTKARRSSYRAQSYSPRRTKLCSESSSITSPFKRPKSPSEIISKREKPACDTTTVHSNQEQEIYDSRSYSPLDRNTLQTDFPRSTSSMFSRVSSGARRSLFTESSSCLRRLLSSSSHLSGKPLGYDAYNQFINVSKTDVLPKYFFENEDEEAVYYLKVKYLDDKDTKL